MKVDPKADWRGDLAEMKVALKADPRADLKAGPRADLKAVLSG